MLLPVWLSVIGLVVPIAPIESPMRISAMAFSGEATGPFPLRAAAAARCCCCFLRLSASLWAFFCASVFVALRVLRYLFKFTFALFFRTGRTAISAAPATFCWQRCCGKDHRRMITRNGAKCQRQGIDGRVKHQKQHRFLRSSRQGHSTVAYFQPPAELRNFAAVESRGNTGLFFNGHLQLLQPGHTHNEASDPLNAQHIPIGNKLGKLQQSALISWTNEL